MPPPASQLTDAEFVAFMRKLEPGEYHMSVTDLFVPFLTPEGGWFFAVGDKTYVVWKASTDRPKEPLRPGNMWGATGPG